MQHQSRPCIVWGFVRLALACAATFLFSAPGFAQVNCATDPVACLGSATNYAVVTQQLKVLGALDRVDASRRAGMIEGSACAKSGLFFGIAGTPAEIAGDLVVTNGRGTRAAYVVPSIYQRKRYDGLRVGGDLVTGGGALRVKWARVAGVTDTSGNDARLAACSSARQQIESASQALAALPADQRLGSLLVAGEDVHVQGHAGINVIHLNSLIIRERRFRRGYDERRVPGRVIIHLPDDRSVAVLNVANEVYVGASSSISADRGRVIINAYGQRSFIKLRKHSSAAAILLTPHGAIYSFLSNTSPSSGSTAATNFLARTVLIRGKAE